MRCSDLITSGILDGRAAGWLSLWDAGRWILLDKIALLGGTFKDVVRGIAGERLNTYQFPALLTQCIHVAPRESASALVLSA